MYVGLLTLVSSGKYPMMLQILIKKTRILPEALARAKQEEHKVLLHHALVKSIFSTHIVSISDLTSLTCIVNDLNLFFLYQALDAVFQHYKVDLQRRTTLTDYIPNFSFEYSHFLL
ncbi:hypothetical protein YC2023_092011 [Brassica napus]